MAVTEWRDLSNGELRERLRAASWRTDMLDGKSLDGLVRRRDDESVAEFIDDVFEAAGR